MSSCKTLFQISGANLKLNCFSFYLVLPHLAPPFHCPTPSPLPQYTPILLCMPAITIVNLPKTKNALQKSTRSGGGWSCKRELTHIYRVFKIIPLTSTHPICNSVKLPDSYSSLLYFSQTLLRAWAISSVLLSPEIIPGTIFISPFSLVKSLPSFLCPLHTLGMESLLCLNFSFFSSPGR